MQTSAMKVHFHIAECSLASAKVHHLEILVLYSMECNVLNESLHPLHVFLVIGSSFYMVMKMIYHGCEDYG